MVTVEQLGFRGALDAGHGGKAAHGTAEPADDEVTGDGVGTSRLSETLRTYLRCRLIELRLAASSPAAMADGGAELAGAAAF